MDSETQQLRQTLKLMQQKIVTVEQIATKLRDRLDLLETTLRETLVCDEAGKPECSCVTASQCDNCRLLDVLNRPL